MFKSDGYQYLMRQFVLPGQYAGFYKWMKTIMQIEDSIEMNKDLLDTLTQSIQRAAEVNHLRVMGRIIYNIFVGLELNGISNLLWFDPVRLKI